MPKSFKALVLKISEQKYSRTENVYYRISFRLETGEFAMTDVVPSYRNFTNWKKIIAAGNGTSIGGVYLKEGFNKPLKVNADSQVFIIQETLLKDPPPPEHEIYQTRARDPEVWSVQGSNGKRHDVVISNGFSTCDCEAFRWSGRKKDCKHTKAVAQQIKDLAAAEIKRTQGTIF